MASSPTALPQPAPGTDADHPPKPSVLDIVRTTLDEGKAEDLVVIDLAGRSSVTDHWVIASGRSSRQVVALAEQIASNLKTAGHGRVPTEGAGHGDWVLIDAGDVVVHLFRPEVRRFYNLEKIWGVEPPPLPVPAYAEAMDDEMAPGGAASIVDLNDADLDLDGGSLEDELSEDELPEDELIDDED